MRIVGSLIVYQNLFKEGFFLKWQPVPYPRLEKFWCLRYLPKIQSNDVFLPKPRPQSFKGNLVLRKFGVPHSFEDQSGGVLSQLDDDSSQEI